MKAAYALSAALILPTIAVAQQGRHMAMARYGGPAYFGKPYLSVTSSLISAGGGPEKFSAKEALTSMLGEQGTTAEMDKLEKQYGKQRVDQWLEVFDFAVDDGAKIAESKKVTLPPPSMKGAELGKTLVEAAKDKTGTLYTELLLDKALTHDIHSKVMDDIDAKYGATNDEDFHRISNQALYDMGEALQVKRSKLATLH